MAHLDPDIYYPAVQSRDARFDGRFFTGVKTTGIYCRPICPARTPLKKNLEFFACAAAAEEAGFRACRRCRPETAPGTPAWAGTSSTVTRALRLIDDGALDDGCVEDLSDRLGVGPRHLRRLFDEHLGASPIAIAQARRVHFARTLLDGSRMPVTEIAFSAGFASVRRFNAVFLKAFGLSPRAVREKVSASTGNNRDRMTVSDELDLKLTFRPPFQWDSIIDFLGPRAMRGVEAVVDGVYHRRVRIGNDHGIIRIQQRAQHPIQRNGQPGRHKNSLSLRVPISLARHARFLAQRARRLCDLGADPEAIGAHLRRDKRLRHVVDKFPGLRVPGAWSPFETSIRGILGQQISVRGATTLAGRIVEKYGETIAGEKELPNLFPDPSRLRRARLESIGVTGARAQCLRKFSAAVDDGDVTFDVSVDTDELIRELCTLPGIGPWTANYIAMRACGEPDAFPAGDLILRRQLATKREKIISEREVGKRADNLRPWRSYAALYFWKKNGFG